MHTPGPWFTEALSTIGHCAIVDADGFTIANPSPMGTANARLIAAAPDLLAALHQVQALLARGTHLGGSAEHFQQYRQACDAVDAAIAAATREA